MPGIPNVIALSCLTHAKNSPKFDQIYLIAREPSVHFPCLYVRPQNLMVTPTKFGNVDVSSAKRNFCLKMKVSFMGVHVQSVAKF